MWICLYLVSSTRAPIKRGGYRLNPRRGVFLVFPALAPDPAFKSTHGPMSAWVAVQRPRLDSLLPTPQFTLANRSTVIRQHPTFSSSAPRLPELQPNNTLPHFSFSSTSVKSVRDHILYFSLLCASLQI